MPRKPLGDKPIAYPTSITLDQASLDRLEALVKALHSQRSGVIRLAIERLYESEVLSRKGVKKTQKIPGKGLET